jgi:hypothetical protein
MTAHGTAAILVVLGAFIAGCAPTTQLPTIASDGGGCRGVGLDAVLRGNAADPGVAWVESQLPGAAQRLDVVFPSGFSARFSPSLEILDGDGHVVAVAGDAITGGCVTGPDARGPLLILGAGSRDIHRR